MQERTGRVGGLFNQGVTILRPTSKSKRRRPRLASERERGEKKRWDSREIHPCGEEGGRKEALEEERLTDRSIAELSVDAKLIRHRLAFYKRWVQ